MAQLWHTDNSVLHPGQHQNWFDSANQIMLRYHYRLKSYIAMSPNLCNRLSAYWKGHSTETALFSVLDEIMWWATTYLQHLMLSHMISWSSSWELGVTGRYYQCIASYLMGDCSQYVSGRRLRRHTYDNCTQHMLLQLVDWLPDTESTTISTLMILSCSPRCQHQRRLLLDYYKIELKHCNIGFGIMDCCLIQANLPLCILAHMVDWGSLSYHHRLPQRAVQWMFQTDCVCWELR